MTNVLDNILAPLKDLVAFDTQNPPRNLSKESEIFSYLCDTFSDFDIKLYDHSDGRVSFYAKRGTPSILFNVHIDTVPAGNLSDWDHPPHELQIHTDTVSGLGSCDIKGAAACLIALSKVDTRDLALLFTTDEEGASGLCIKEFTNAGLASEYTQVIVAEPTNCEAVIEHSGFVSVHMDFKGLAGHSSNTEALKLSATHHLVQWANSTLEYVNKEYADNTKARFNLGKITGGVKSNISAAEAFANWSARLDPGSDTENFLENVKGLIPESADVSWRASFYGPPLPTKEFDNSSAQKYIDTHGLTKGAAVGFWTEASLFNASGTPALVLGPGDIKQAHTANEWVRKDQLVKAYEIYELLSRP